MIRRFYNEKLVDIDAMPEDKKGKKKEEGEDTVYRRLTKALSGTNYSFKDYIQIRRHIMNLVPLHVSYCTYLTGYFCKCFKGKSYERYRKFERAKEKVESQFDLIKLMKRVGKLNIVKKLVLKQHHQKLIKFSHYNTIQTNSSESEGE
jgi:hypothetical protein